LGNMEFRIDTSRPGWRQVPAGPKIAAQRPDTAHRQRQTWLVAKGRGRTVMGRTELIFRQE